MSLLDFFSSFTIAALSLSLVLLLYHIFHPHSPCLSLPYTLAQAPLPSPKYTASGSFPLLSKYESVLILHMPPHLVTNYEFNLVQ